MNAQLDISLGLIPTLASLAFLVGAFGVFVAGGARGNVEHRDRAFFVRFFYWLVEPLIDLLARMGVPPNAITATSLVLALATGTALATGHFLTAVWLMMVASAGDAIDGLLARSNGDESTSGAFFDSFMDRLAEGAFFGGLAIFGGGGPLTWASVVALVGSYGVSYARARGESLGADGKVGLMQRPQRLVVLIAAVLVGGAGVHLGAGMMVDTALTVMTWIVAILGVMALVTAFRRAHAIMDQLDEIGSDSDSTISDDPPIEPALDSAVG